MFKDKNLHMKDNQAALYKIGNFIVNYSFIGKLIKLHIR